LYLNYLQNHKNAEKPSDVKIDFNLRLSNNTIYDESGQLDFAGTNSITR
jgi:hypothetical protein